MNDERPCRPAIVGHQKTAAFHEIVTSADSPYFLRASAWFIFLDLRTVTTRRKQRTNRPHQGQDARACAMREAHQRL
jgi:hypothetical protein